MKRIILLPVFIILTFRPVISQTDTLFLEECLIAAQKYAPVADRRNTISEITELKILNTRAAQMPSLAAYGKAWYQSDAVTVITGVGPGLEIDRFQYNTGVEANQKLFDGNMSKHSREVELTSFEAETGRLDMELYQLNNQIVNLFFQSILLGKNLSVLELKKELLQERVKELKTGFENGVIKRNELESLQAELLLARQQEIEFEKQRQQNLSILNQLTGISIHPNMLLSLSDSLLEIPPAVRPEINYYDAESSRIESLANLQKTQNMPKLYAFGQAGYSYPGLNFFENQSDYYYIVGARLSWTLFDWNQNKRKQEVIRMQMDVVNTQRADFEQKRSISRSSELIEQQQLTEMIELDMAIIEQRSSITKGSETALKNGVITSSQYLEDLNNEIRARLDMELHSIQLESSRVRLKLLDGIDIIQMVNN
jgi:outer membrane protein TolC